LEQIICRDREEQRDEAIQVSPDWEQSHDDERHSESAIALA
jgi:hypothetical protein